MAAGTATAGQQVSEPTVMLGGYAGLAEGAWMGAAQGSEFLEPLRISTPRLRAVVPCLPRIRLAGLLTREFSVAEAAFILMASFFFSAVLGALRQILFNAQCLEPASRQTPTTLPFACRTRCSA